MRTPKQTPQRRAAMSLGMLRRSSITFERPPAAAGRAAHTPALVDRQEARRATLAGPPLSSIGERFSRLSLGIANALQRLGLRAAAAAPAAPTAAADVPPPAAPSLGAAGAAAAGPPQPPTPPAAAAPLWRSPIRAATPDRGSRAGPSAALASPAVELLVGRVAEHLPGLSVLLRRCTP
jgi:hypothetical protein